MSDSRETCGANHCKVDTLGDVIRRIDDRTQRIEERHERTEKKVDELHRVVNGDGNGRVGLVRKQDETALRVSMIERLGWLIVGAVVASLVVGGMVAIGVR